LLVEPHAEVMQSYPRRQPPSQSLDLMRTLPPEAEGVEEFVINRLDDLTYPSNPPPKTLGPGLFGVSLGRMNNLRPVAFKPTPMVLGTFETLVGYVGTTAERADATQSGIRSGPYGEEGLGQRLVGGGGTTEAEASDYPCRIDRGEQREALVPSYAVGPSDVSLSCEPSMSSALGVPDGHRRAVQSLVRTLWSLQQSHQMQDESLDEVGVGAYQAVDLRTVGQAGEGIPQFGVGVTIEVSLAVETTPTGKDGQGKHLAPGEGWLRTGPSFWRLRVAEVVDDDVECGEEGVHIDHEESVPFPWGNGIGKPTLKGGHLPLKLSPDNSHQAFKGVDLQMGAGKSTIDLTGDYAQGFDASIEGGVGEATVLLPSEVGVKAKAEGGLGKINAEGLKRVGGSYVNDAYGESDVNLSVDVESGVGQINLKVV
jgi:hypothetical protein